MWFQRRKVSIAAPVSLEGEGEASDRANLAVDLAQRREDECGEAGEAVPPWRHPGQRARPHLVRHYHRRGAVQGVHRRLHRHLTRQLALLRRHRPAATICS